jgi:hypothetical protein
MRHKTGCSCSWAQASLKHVTSLAGMPRSGPVALLVSSSVTRLSGHPCRFKSGYHPSGSSAGAMLAGALQLPHQAGDRPPAVRAQKHN